MLNNRYITDLGIIRFGVYTKVCIKSNFYHKNIDISRQMLVFRFHLEFGIWSLGFGVWDLEFGIWSLGFKPLYIFA